jgi:SAM-dependent methyltransferase
MSNRSAHTHLEGTDITAPAAVCPICKGDESEYRFTHHDFHVFGCSVCGVEYLNPQPDDDVLSAIYDEQYFLGERENVQADAASSLKRATAKIYVDRILTLNCRPGLKLLEIGCGTGDFLFEAQSRGMRVSGIEYSAPAVTAANRKLGAPIVKQGSIESVVLPEALFDVIAFSDVIEHVRDPRRFVRRAYSALKPGGFVFVVTPSLDNWSRKVMGRRWMEYKTEHLFYFGRKSLHRLFLSAGYENVTCLPNYKIVSLEYVNAHFQRFHVPVWTPLLGALSRAIPKPLGHKHVQMVASGIIVLAYRPGETAANR